MGSRIGGCEVSGDENQDTGPSAPRVGLSPDRLTRKNFYEADMALFERIQ